MNGARLFFIVFAALVALVGLFAAALGSGYIQVFGAMLIVFGIGFAFSCVKRHFDELEALLRAGPDARH